MERLSWRRICFLSLCLICLVSVHGNSVARPVNDINDPAFSNAEVVDISADLVIPQDVIRYQFNRAGHTISLTRTQPDPRPIPLEYYLITSHEGDLYVPSFEDNEGVIVTISPAVSAIGFNAGAIDLCAGGTYIGANAEEFVTVTRGGFACGDFFGSTDIGPISTVQLVYPYNVFTIKDIVFVPETNTNLDRADVSVGKSSTHTQVFNDERYVYSIDVENLGPDEAENVEVVDFLPKGVKFASSSQPVTHDATNNLIRADLGELQDQGTDSLHLAVDAPSYGDDFWCRSRLLNVATVVSDTQDPDLLNNIAMNVMAFESSRVRDLNPPEVCDNGVDDDCDGFTDCLDSECAEECAPDPLGPLGPGTGPNVPSAGHACAPSRGVCPRRTFPQFCCDPGFWSNPKNNIKARACHFEDGCRPEDPNFKEADPGVTYHGFGYTQSGNTLTYTLHYENIGNGDALNVSVLDVLDENLDAETLNIITGDAQYYPETRTVVFRDPHLPPGEHRSVSFSIQVNSNAPPGTRIPNSATIIFPNAFPPSRIETNVVEHRIIDPNNPPGPDLSILRCERRKNTADEWDVVVINSGEGYAYNVTASAINPPPNIRVSTDIVSFAHYTDEAPDELSTVIPMAYTHSREPFIMETDTPVNPCGAMNWQIDWEDINGVTGSRQIQLLEDGDNDGIADEIDNCPETANGPQLDSDNNGVGDACEPVQPMVCDVDLDGDVDRIDTASILGARNQPAEQPFDPRDSDQNGVINILDARLCVTLCSNARCQVIN